MSEATNTTLPDSANKDGIEPVVVANKTPESHDTIDEVPAGGFTKQEKTMKEFLKLVSILPTKFQKDAEVICRRLSGSQEGLIDTSFDRILDEKSLQG